jgi:hypothetical protein
LAWIVQGICDHLSPLYFSRDRRRAISLRF